MSYIQKILTCLFVFLQPARGALLLVVMVQPSQENSFTDAVHVAAEGIRIEDR